MKFVFLKLFPCFTSDGVRASGNLVLQECEAHTKEQAIQHFRQTSPVSIDNTGYGKQETGFSYCVAETHS